MQRLTKWEWLGLISKTPGGRSCSVVTQLAESYLALVEMLQCPLALIHRTSGVGNGDRHYVRKADVYNNGPKPRWRWGSSSSA